MAVQQSGRCMEMVNLFTTLEEKLSEVWATLLQYILELDKRTGGVLQVYLEGQGGEIRGGKVLLIDLFTFWNNYLNHYSALF